MSPVDAPRAAPLDELGLPVSLPNAFGDPNLPCSVPMECYFYLGANALRRQSLGNGILANFNPSAAESPIGSAVNPPALRFNNVVTNYAPGVTATVGTRCGAAAFEISAFYVPANEANAQVLSAGQLDTFFANPPVGFGGNAGLWTRANLIRTTLRDTLTNVELTYRQAPRPGLEWLSGIRLMELNEQLRIFTDDDGFGVPPTTLSNQATHTVRTFNRMGLVQFGFEAVYPVPCTYDMVALGCTGKGAWGANWIRADENLARGDGVIGFDNRQNTTRFVQMYEAGGFVDFVCADRLRFRAGYQFLWIQNLALAPDNLEFNLGNAFVIQNNNGSVFFHGPLLEMHVAF